MNVTVVARTVERWPDWSSRPVLLVASGPSAKDAVIAPLRGKVFVMAIKQGVELCPWADAVYGCDRPWWEWNRGLPKFAGLKMAWEGNPPARLFPDVVPISIPDPKSNTIRLDKIGVVGSGRNSGFQGLNLAVQFGARKILLVGYDVTDRSGAHYYGRNSWPRANNPTRDNFIMMQEGFRDASLQLTKLGVEVINTSQWSALNCFRKATLEDAAREWGL